MLGNVPLIEGRFHVNRTNCLVHPSAVHGRCRTCITGNTRVYVLQTYICSDGALHDYLSAAGSNLEGGEFVYQGPVGGLRGGS